MTNSDDLMKKLMQTFREEAQDILGRFSADLINLERESAAEERQRLIETLYRRMHTLKGSSQAVGLFDVVEICQSLESILAALKRGEIEPDMELLDRVHGGVDAIDALIFPPGKSGPAAERTPMPDDGGAGEADATETAAFPLPDDETPRPDETVRVPARLLEELLIQAEELVSARLAAAELVNELSSMAAELPVPRGGRSDDPLAAWTERRLETARKSAEKNRHNLDMMVGTLIRDMKRLHLLPFSQFMEPFPKMTRDMARELGKDVELRSPRGDMAIDRRILAGLRETLIHMVRNVIDHGIEAEHERLAAGKPAKGRIDIGIRRVDGNRAELTVSDDGRGIDPGSVKAAAVRKGLLAPRDMDSLPDSEAYRFIFHSGVSTAPIVTSFSGRGLGLAIVRDAVETLGGEVAVTAEPGRGTVFRIVFPLSFSTVRCLLVEVHGQECLIPSANVEFCARVPLSGIGTVENRETISLEGTALSLARLGEIIGIPAQAVGPSADRLQVVVLSSADKRIAFAVDQLLEVEEVLVKALGPQLARVRNVAGAAVLGRGKVVPVLNAADIVKSAVNAGTSIASPYPRTSAVKEVRVLVAEDSITSRTLLRNILESSGFLVKTAVDGVEAIGLLRTEEFDVVVSDVEMPRMNGFDLTAAIRGDANLSGLPVVLVTGLESREDRERGIDVGASAYIVKSSFDQSGLIEVIRKLT